MLKSPLTFLKHYKCFITFLFVFTFLSGCSSTNENPEKLIEPVYSADRVIKEDTKTATDIYDPWESFNRKMYVFNYHFDKYVFLPIVNGYRYVMPDFAEDMVSNFFLNLGEITNLFNSAIQLKVKESSTTVGRLVVNSTIGLFGFFDPATSMKMFRVNEDFGQTLGHYGLGAGPYLVLPILGPSSLRDASGLIVDNYVNSEAIDKGIEELSLSSDDELLLKNSLSVIKAIDIRHRTEFRYYDTGSPFEYELVRLLYKTKRDLDVAK